MNKPRYRIHFRESGTYAIAVNEEAYKKGAIVIPSINTSIDTIEHFKGVLYQLIWSPKEILTNVLPAYLPK